MRKEDATPVLSHQLLCRPCSSPTYTKKLKHKNEATIPHYLHHLQDHHLKHGARNLGFIHLQVLTKHCHKIIAFKIMGTGVIIQSIASLLSFTDMMIDLQLHFI